MASRKHRRLIRYWPERDQSPKFRGLYNLRRQPKTTGTVGGKPRTTRLLWDEVGLLKYDRQPILTDPHMKALEKPPQQPLGDGTGQ